MAQGASCHSAGWCCSH